MHDITLFGEVRCHKTRFYQSALEERGLAYELAEVDKDPRAAERLTKLAGSAGKFPTFQIKGRKLRNPKLPELDKELARGEITVLQVRAWVASFAARRDLEAGITVLSHALAKLPVEEAEKLRALGYLE